ncbi:MAG: glutamate--tRNA ligase [Nanoarchaeota archaeon]
MKQLIRKLALQNAIRYEGKANPGAVIGHILSKDPSLKEKAKEITTEIMEIIKEVNSMCLDDQKKELEKSAPELLKEKKKVKEEKKLKLKNVKGRVVMRFEPSPSGPLHIGHAYVLGLNSELVKEYGGRLILRIADTNPEKIYEPAYKLIPEDAKWVTKDNVSEVLVQSDRLDIYYRYMKRLLEIEKAYVCTCDPESFRGLINDKKACPCRSLLKEEQISRWDKMFKGYKQGEAVVRIKTDVQHKNPAMRDFPVFRINESKHPRQGKKYRVWPLMNMAVTVDDIESGVTHIIRAKDHYDNALRQKFIYEYLDKKFPETIFVGRINFEGMPVSCSKTRPKIEDGTYSGWDDIRLPFLMALKRRGYQPEALMKYAVDVGITLTDKTVAIDEFFKNINAFNKEVIDAESFRYFFIWNPKKITIEGAPSQEIELDLHPDNKKGGRKFKVKDVFYVTEDDYTNLKDGNLYRLMDCLNFVKKGNKLVFDSLDYDKFKEKGKGIIHWLAEENIKINVRMPDNKIIEGLAEKGIDKVKVGKVVQLERLGFCRKDKDKDFWFGHK